MSTLLGKKLLNYRIEKLLGQGGMGEVYLGVHTEIGRKVAIKVISPHLAQEPRIQERFKREALILAKLDHPNIVQLYDYWAKPEQGLFLIMEYVEGVSLDRYIHRVLRGPIPTRQAIELFLQVLDAFQYAHDNGVIHRDIKPSNILLRSDNVVKVLDFGIARIMMSHPTEGGEELALTKTGTTLGTVTYMSPEQLRAKSPGDIDHRSDIYSLGVVLFEMLTGREMYDRSQLSEFDILVKIASEPPPPLSELSPHLAFDFEPILKKALAKKREERYQSCRDFAGDLLRLLPKYAQQEVSPPPRNPVLTQTRASLPDGASLFQRTYAQIRQSVQKTRSWSAGQKLIVGLIVLGVIGGLVALGRMAWSASAEKKQALQTAEIFLQALKTHDQAAIDALLADTLSSFFEETQVPKRQAVQKYYAAFWESLQQDSVAWAESPTAQKKEDRWIVDFSLYQRYTTKKQVTTQRISEKRYNRWYGRYDTYYRTETRTIPPATICKVKRMRLYLCGDKIVALEVLSEKEC